MTRADVENISDPQLAATEHEFVGWEMLPDEPFDNFVGPFFHRALGEGRMECAFRAEHRHTNGVQLVHGGCLLTLADYCLFVTAKTRSKGQEIVTVSLGSEFVGGARSGQLIRACGEVVRAGTSMIFARGLVYADDRPVLNFSGSTKIIRPRPPRD